LLSFWRRSRKASMPSFCSGVAGSGGGVVFTALNPGFVRSIEPTLGVEYAEARDVVVDTDVRCFVTPPTLCTLSCVSVLLCPNNAPLFTGDLGALEVLGLRSARPSKGPGEMLSIRFATFSPPSIRGLSGAKRGLGSAYRCWGGNSGLSRGCGLAL
jgi:hypothetical protein